MVSNNDDVVRGHRMTKAESDLSAIPDINVPVFNETLQAKPMLGPEYLCVMTKFKRIFTDDAFIRDHSYLIRIRDDHIREFVRSNMWFEARRGGRIDAADPNILSELEEALTVHGLHAIFRYFSESNTNAVFAAYVNDVEYFPVIPSTILDACDKANETQTEPPIEIWDLHIDLSKI